MIDSITVLIISGYNPSKLPSAGVETLYFATHEFVSSSTDIPPNTYFKPLLSNPGSFSQSMYAPGTTGGNSSGGFGFIELNNSGGALDYLIDWGFDGRECKIMEGSMLSNLSTFSTVLVGTVEQIEHTWDKITLRFKDRSAELKKSIALHYYTGDNNGIYDSGGVNPGVNGLSDLKGKSKPRLFGYGYNIVPPCVNASKLAFQMQDGAILSPISVRDGGLLLTLGTEHPSLSALWSATPVAGTYDTYLAEGIFRLGSNLWGTISYSAISDWSYPLGTLIKNLVEEALGVDIVIEQCITELNVLFPYTAYLNMYDAYSGTEGSIDTNGNVTGGKTYFDIIDTLCSAGLWWGFDDNGKFWVKQFTEPELNINPISTLDESVINSIERLATRDDSRGVPVWKVNVDYLIFTPLSNFAGSVSEQNKINFSEPFRRVTASDSAIKTKHPLATELTVKSCFLNSTQAQTEADRQLTMRSIRRDRVRVSVPAKFFQYPTGGYWDDEAFVELPAPLLAFATASDSSHFYVVGGAFDTVSPTSTTNEVKRLSLNNPTGAWETISPMLTKRQLHASVISDNWLYAIGGKDDSYTNLATIERLDLSNPSGTWVTTTSMPSAGFMGSAIVHGGYLYIVSFSAFGSSWEVKRLDISNPSSIGTVWENLANLNDALSGPGLAIYGNYLMVIGGQYTPRVFVRDLTGALLAPWQYATLSSTSFTSLSDAFNSYLVVGSNLYCFVNPNKVVRFPIAGLPITGIPTWKGQDLTFLPQYRSYLKALSILGQIYLIGSYVNPATPGVPIVTQTWKYRTNDSPTDKAELTSLGRTIKLKLKRYGYTLGKNMKIIGVEKNYATKNITLELWG